MSIGSGVEIYHLVICHLVGRQNFKICLLVGRRIISFGRIMSFRRVSKYVISSCFEIYHLVICHLVRRRKHVISSGVEVDHFIICHFVAQQNMSFGRRRIMSFGHRSKYVIVVGRRNMSFGQASEYVIWSSVEIYHLDICHLVGRRNLSFGRVAKYVNWSGIELFHLVGWDTLSGFEI